MRPAPFSLPNGRLGQMTEQYAQITVAEALGHARKLLRFRPAAAAKQALAIIAAEPNLAEPHLLRANRPPEIA